MPPSELHLAAEPVAPALARAGLVGALGDLPEQTVNDVTLLTSELVSNAVRHALAPADEDVVVRIELDRDRIHIAVHDAGVLFSPPALRKPFDASPSGWGLYLLDRVADAWGIDAEATGKTVWFEIDVPPTPASPIEP